MSPKAPYAIDLREIGSYRYAQHPSTIVRCASFCLTDNGARGPIETWVSGEPVPATWVAVAANPDIPICAFNIPFDGQILEQILVPRHGFPPISRSRWRCAEAAALARALPMSLDGAAKALGIEGKDKAGAALMRRLAKPRPQTKQERKAGVPLDFSITPEELAGLVKYNVVDTRVLMGVVDIVGLLSSSEQAVWQLNQTINERGVHLDVPLLNAALAIVNEAKINNNNHLAELTGGIVTSPHQTKRILKWSAEYGHKLANIKKNTVAEALLKPELPEPVRRLLELRQSGAGAAPSKLPTLQLWTDKHDQRIRGAYKYHRASSGRFTSLGCQLHNLKKPEMEDITGAIAAVSSGSLTEVRARGFEPLATIGQLVRALPTPAPGKRFLIADLSGIEARVAALIVGDTRELDQWRTFDHSGRKEDEPYYIAGIKTFNQPPSSARKAGKTGQLAFQYQGGVGAYRKITGDTTTLMR
jgi:DNA polymerase